MKIPVVPFVALVAPFLSATVFAADVPPIRIVNCGDHVQSRKRGVCENHLSAEDFKVLSPGVSWYYNWNITTNDSPPSGVQMEYFPQAWGHGDGDAATLDTYLSAHKDKLPRVVLALNEPNLKDQSFMPPQAAADLYKKIKAAADKYNVPVVGPNMSLGSPDNGSITAMDPLDKKEVKYTFMVPYLKAFYYFMGDTSVPAAAYHTYGNIGELKWATGELYKQFQQTGVGHGICILEMPAAPPNRSSISSRPPIISRVRRLSPVTHSSRSARKITPRTSASFSQSPRRPASSPRSAKPMSICPCMMPISITASPAGYPPGVM